MEPFSYCEPGLMNNVFTPTLDSQSRMFFAVNSKPFSMRIWSGTPLWTNKSPRRSRTSSLVSRDTTWRCVLRNCLITRHARRSLTRLQPNTPRTYSTASRRFAWSIRRPPNLFFQQHTSARSHRFSRRPLQPSCSEQPHSRYPVVLE